MNREADAEVLFRLFPASDGGRAAPVSSGYRPAYDIRPDYWTSAIHEFISPPEVSPGEQAKARVWFITPEVYPRTLWVGRALQVAEGSRVVGSAVVERVLNPSLLIENA